MLMEEHVMVRTTDRSMDIALVDFMYMQISMSVATELIAVSKYVITPRDPITASAIVDMN